MAVEHIMGVVGLIPGTQTRVGVRVIEDGKNLRVKVGNHVSAVLTVEAARTLAFQLIDCADRCDGRKG